MTNSRKREVSLHIQHLKDMRMGGRNEKEMEARLENFFGCDFENKAKDRWRVLDLISDKNKIVIEMKSRRSYYTTYPTTIIGKHKYDEALRYMDKGYNAYFSFRFKNGDMYIYKVPYKLQDDITIEEKKTYKRGREEICNSLCIPIKYLDNMVYFEDIEDYENHKKALES